MPTNRSKRSKCLTDEQAKLYAYRRLARQPTPTPKLRTLLHEKGANSAAIEKIITDLTALGYLDDDAWLEGFIARQKRLGRGPRRIQQDLKRYGFFLDTIPQTDDEEREQIAQLLATRYKNTDLTQHKEKQRLIAALQRRGFSLDIIFSQLCEKLQNNLKNVII